MTARPNFMDLSPVEILRLLHPNDAKSYNSLDIIQHMQNEWKDYCFPANTSIDQYLGVVEEVGELAHAILKTRQGIRLDEDHQAQEIDAIGDIAIFLLGYCNDRGLNLMSIIETTWLEVYQRDWPKERQEHLDAQ